MNKRTIIILTIISTVFSLVYILAVYFGWTRYLGIRMSTNSDKLTENYSKFLGSVLYIQIYEYLGEYEDDDEDYSIPRRFKNWMKDLYDSKETDTDSDTD